MNRIILMLLLAVVSNSAMADGVPARKSDTKVILGTESAPIAVKILPAPDAEDTARKQEDWRKEKATEDSHMTLATIWLAIFTFFLMLFTGYMWQATVALGREAKATSDRQAQEMQSSLTIARQSAVAMTDVAEATRNNALLMQDVMHKQMRAYLVADIGGGTYQDSKLNFGASPVLLNTGFTPAKNVSYKIDAGVLDLNGDIKTKLDDIGAINKYDAALSPRQTFIIHGMVKDRFSEDDVAEIMKGEKRRLFVWGTVTYDDIFGKAWETNFCHSYMFYTDEENKIRHSAYYHPFHNNAS